MYNNHLDRSFLKIETAFMILKRGGYILINDKKGNAALMKASEFSDLDDGILKPTTDNDVDLGTSSLEFKDGYFDGTLHCDVLDLNGTEHTAIEDPTALAIALG